MLQLGCSYMLGLLLQPTKFVGNTVFYPAKRLVVSTGMLKTGLKYFYFCIITYGLAP